MNNETLPEEKKKFNFIVIYILGFIISVFFEFYWISYFPYDYFMLFGIGIILCIFGYLSIDGVLDQIHKSELRKEKQNEVMIKASKAIYLTTKKMLAANPEVAESDYILPGEEVKKDTAPADNHNNNFNDLVSDLVKANERLAASVEQAVSIKPLVDENKKIIQSVQTPLSPEIVPEKEAVPEPENIVSEPEPVLSEIVSEEEEAVPEPENTVSEPEPVLSEIISAEETATSETESAIPETEPTPQAPAEEAGDGTKQLSQEEIAALFANL